MADEDEKRRWVERVLGVTLSGEPDTDPGPFARMYQDLLETVNVDLQQLHAVDLTAAETIAKVVSGAAGFAAKGDYETAFGYLSRVSDAIARHTGAGRVKEVTETIPTGIVADTVALLEQAEARWNRVITDARATADALHKDLADSFPESAGGLQRILDSYWEDMFAAISQARSSGGGESDIAAVIVEMDSLREEMLADELFSYLDSNGIAVRPAFFGAFDELTALLGQ